MMVMSPAGQLKGTTCSLTKQLDTFRIVRSGKIRRIPLTDIQNIHSGLEPEGLTTPLDDLCATMAIGPDGALITFRFEHINARDTFVMCMMLFAQSLSAQGGDGEDWGGGDDDGEYAEEEYGEEEDDYQNFEVSIEDDPDEFARDDGGNQL